MAEVWKLCWEINASHSVDILKNLSRGKSRRETRYKMLAGFITYQ
jgi:hypothetical protein